MNPDEELGQDRGQGTTAAEFALGVLDGEERAAALRRVLAEPEFAREVETWRAHFGVLFDQSHEEAAPTGLFERIETSLEPTGRSAGYWPALTAAMTLVAALLLLVIVLRPAGPLPGPPPAPLVASLDSAGPGAALPAIYDPVRGELRIPAAAASAPGRSAELWMIGSDGVPRSLGLLDARQRNVIPIGPADRAKLVPGLKLAISSEPSGGSPTGLPTGPIVASGALISS